MAILTTSNLLSGQRYDISDARRIESGVRDDFDTTVSAIITNTTQGYFIRGFSILTAGAIGAPANGLQLVVDPGAVLHIDASVSGTIFQTPTGTPNQILNAASNSNVIGSFAANSTNYVGIDYLRFADPTTDVTKYIWNSSSDNEITTIAPAAQTLTYQIYITTSVWAANVLPVAIVTTDANGNVLTITDARWNLYSLETGGLDPNPNYVYPWSEGRTQPPVTVSALNSSQDPFVGGDKQLTCLKDWMNAVMTTFLEVKGTPYWFSSTIGPGPGPAPSIASLFQDLGNTVITGKGEISNGILPNSDSILVTTGTVTSGSNQLTSLASTAGLSNGDYIFGIGIPTDTTIVSISGSTITMSQNATTNGIGITVSFYSPSAITTPGQINWDDAIEIRVIGSSLTYTIAANSSSTDISLTDDEVAYLSLVREEPITPQLIFNAGSNSVSSVGNVLWTSAAGLIAGDYIKVTSDTTSSYYQVASVNVNGYTVTLTTNVVAGDNYPGGTPAQYAYGSYYASATPSGDPRAIQIALRANVPINKNTFWLFMREDNGGNPRVYIRFLSEELDNGQSVQISGTTSLELLEYIGSSGASDSSPQYVSSLDPGSVAQISTFTLGAGSTITGGQYFNIYSSANGRSYAGWFKVSGVGTQPVVANIDYYIEFDVLSTDSASAVATKFANTFNTYIFRDFSAVATGSSVVVTNTSAGTCSPASNFSVGAPFAVVSTQTGTGSGNYVVHDGDNLTLGIKELDESIGAIYATLDSPTYDEIFPVASPISIGGYVTLPNNSRLAGTPAQYYTVGKGALQVWLNGQFLDVESGAYLEVGVTGNPSNQIQMEYALLVGDQLEFRLNGGGSNLGQAVGPAGAPGAMGPRGFDALQGPVSISTKVGPTTYPVLSTDCFLEADCTSGAVTFTLPSVSTVTGNAFYFKKIDSSSNYMYVTAFGSDLIDGLGTQSTNTQYYSFALISDGMKWNLF